MLVPRKGTEFPWLAMRAAEFIEQIGHNRVTLRCDNEPALEAWARQIVQASSERGDRLFLRDRQWEKASPTGSLSAQWDLLPARPEH